MSRKRGFRPEEIGQLLRDLSDYESEGGELSYIGAPSDDEIFICPDLSDSSSDEEAVNNFHSENSQQNGFKFLQKDYVTKQIFRNIKNFTI